MVTGINLAGENVLGGEPRDHRGLLFPQEERLAQELGPGLDGSAAESDDTVALLEPRGRFGGLAGGVEKLRVEVVDDRGEGAANADLWRGQHVGQDRAGVNEDEKRGQ